MRRAISIALFAVLANSVWAQAITLSVSDFTVESPRAEYMYIGKGISRLVAGELRKAPTIRLIEREQLERILKEQELSLSDVSDQQSQIRVGKLVAADYIVLGEIIDMLSTLLISVRVVDVSTGEVVWTAEITEKLTTYDYIGAYLAKSILTEFGAQVDKSIVVKTERKEEKKEEAIIKLSKGIDAYDRKDTDTAKRVLEEVTRLDPASEVAAYYLAKLLTNTAKFKVVIEPYYSYENPACLGMIKADRLHFSSGGNYFSNPLYGGTMQGGYAPIPGYPDLTVREQEFRHLNVGYYFPLGLRFGMGVEGFWSMTTDEASDDSGSALSRRMPLGATVGFGAKLGELLALGLGVSVYSQQDFIWGPLADIPDVAVAGNAGMAYQSRDERLHYDTRVGYSTGVSETLDLDTVTIEGVVHSPLFWENTFTMVNESRTTFLVVKQLNDVSWDRVYYYGRLLPAVEHYFTDWLSVRAGLEGSYVVLNESGDLGYGALAGLTFRITKRKLDIDLNVAYRRKPSRVVEGFMRHDLFVTFGLSRGDLFLSR